MAELKFKTVIDDKRLQNLLDSLNDYYVDDFDYGIPRGDEPITIKELKSTPAMLEVFIAEIKNYGTKEWDEEKFQGGWLSEMYELRN